MDKAAVLSHILKSSGKSTVVGGQLPATVISSNSYIAGAQGTEDEWSSLDGELDAALSGESRAVVLLGAEGCGKTTALINMVAAWAKGERLQHFSHVFYFQFSDLNSLPETFSLETLIQRQHSHTPVPMQPLLQEPEKVLLLFDGLSEYRHGLDPSVHALCSDPSQEASASCVVSSLLHGSLLKGAAFVVATRPTESLALLGETREVKALGFLKPQREAYFGVFFPDPATAKQAHAHMEQSVGFYEFAASPRFCWTVCSVYKPLLDSGAKLPETLTRLFVEILVQLLRSLSLSKASNRELVLALGRLASQCSLGLCSGSVKEQMDVFGLQQFVSSVDVFLRSDGCVLSFRAQLVQQFVLAICLLLDESASDGLENRLEQHRSGSPVLDFFLSGLSVPLQRGPLEVLLGDFNPDQIQNFISWFKSSSKAKLQGFQRNEHFRYFHMLHQAQSDSLAREIVNPSTHRAISYCEISVQDSAALNYVITCLGQIETLNLYSSKLSEEAARFLAPAMSLSQTINLSSSWLTAGSVSHLASALSRGLTQNLEMSTCRLDDEQREILCAALKDSKLQNVNFRGCGLTEVNSEHLASMLSSNTSQLCMLELSFNKIGVEGFRKLFGALQDPHCKLEELQLRQCNLSEASMKDLSVALCAAHSPLRKIDLMQNLIGDSGAKSLFESLKHPHCKLLSLKIFDIEASGSCCTALKEALMSEHCCLSELDVSVNELGQEGALQICQALSQPGCPVETLGLARCELTEAVFKELGSVLKSGTSRLKSLTVGLNAVGDVGVKHLWDALVHPACLLEDLDVEMTQLTDAAVEDLCAAIRACKTLKSIELRNNLMTDASVPALVQVMHDSPNVLEMCLKYNDFSEDVFEIMDECDRIRY